MLSFLDGLHPFPINGLVTGHKKGGILDTRERRVREERARVFLAKTHANTSVAVLSSSAIHCQRAATLLSYYSTA